MIFCFTFTGCSNKTEDKNRYTGTIECESYYVTSEIAGQINKLSALEGSSVKKGDSIAKIDTQRYKFEKDKAEGMLQSAQAKYDNIPEAADENIKNQAKGTVNQAKAAVKLAEFNISKGDIKSLKLGKLIPYIFIGLFSLALGLIWFNVPIRGNLMLLLFLGVGFVICALAMGILISAVSKTQLQAMQLSVLIILPSVLLSGFVFPREAMPKAIQLIGNLLPLTYFLNILRGIITKGVGIQYLLQDVLLLFSLGVVLLILSIVIFWKKPYNA